jgi:hypothetical protein
VIDWTVFCDFLFGTVFKCKIFASEKSLDVRTLDSLRVAKLVIGFGILESFGSAFAASIVFEVCLSGILDGCLGTAAGELEDAFFRDQGMAEPMDPQKDEAFVLVDLIEDASDTGDDWPDEDSE